MLNLSSLNQRVNALTGKINNLAGSANLDGVLTLGNNAGSNDIDMNNQDILQVNNIDVVTINGSAYPPSGSTSTLQQVLTAGNTATNLNLILADATGSTTFNTNNITHVDTLGNDLSISSNQNLTISADNIDIGTSRLIYPTLSASSFMDFNNGGLKISNNTGGTANPVLNLTQSASGGSFLVQETYNARTATTGNFSQQSQYAKMNNGTKQEYTQIQHSASSTSNGAFRGQMYFNVAQAGVMSNYMTINGQNQHIDINKTLHMNNQNIVSCETIETPTGNFYLKGVNEYYTTNTFSPTLVEDKLRWAGVNLGKPNTWVQASSVNDFSSAGGSVENVTASWSAFAGAWWVGTESGNVYYTFDSGSSWTLFNSFGGRINCFQEIQTGTYLAIGGQFTGTYNYLAFANTGYTITDLTGLGGMNGEVKCLWSNTSNGCLYVGGAFDDFFGGGGGLSKRFITYDYNTGFWFNFNNTTGAGFLNGDVFTITQDVNNSNYIIVGGSFTDEDTGSGSINIPYLFTYQTTNGYDVVSYFSIGASLGANVNSAVPYSSGVLIGGDFSNPLTSPSWTDSYGIYIYWNGTNWDLNNYLFSPSNYITNITHIPSLGEYFTTTNTGSSDTLYKGSTQTPAIPVGQRWYCIAYNGSSALYSTNAQTSAGFLFYELDQSVTINITASGLQTFNTSGGQGYTTIQMYSIGSSFELVYRLATDNWWLITQNSCGFS